MTFTLTLSHVLAAILAVAGGSGTLGAIVALGAFHRWIKPAIRAEITTYEGEAATVEARKHGYLGEVNGAAIFADNTAANNWVYNSGTKRLVPAASALLSASNLPTLSGVTPIEFGQRYLLVFSSGSDPGSNKPWGPQTGIYEVVNEEATPRILVRVGEFDDDDDISTAGKFCDISGGDYAGRLGIFSGRSGDVLDTDSLYFTITAASGGGGVSQEDLDDVANDLLGGAGRKLVGGPSDITGTGGLGTETDVYTDLTIPSNMTFAGGSKYRISGTILVRTTGWSSVASVQVNDAVLMYHMAYPAWEAQEYPTPIMVIHEGHLYSTTGATASDEPYIGSTMPWQDNSITSYVPGVAGWDEVRNGDSSPEMAGGAETYFGDEAHVTGLGFNPATGALALVSRPINGQSVRVEFDGTIASIGFN